MALWRGKSRRKKSGGFRHYARKKRRFEIGREVEPLYLGETRKKITRTKGAGAKVILTSETWINAYDPSTGKTKRVKVITVTENPANPHYVRRNIITKGAIVETEDGKARITSRPGQHGILNGVLFKSKAK